MNTQHRITLRRENVYIDGKRRGWYSEMLGKLVVCGNAIPLNYPECMGSCAVGVSDSDVRRAIRDRLITVLDCYPDILDNA